jgi:hypothetical protein
VWIVRGIRLEQFFQLLRGLLRGLDELGFVVLLEQRHRALRGGTRVY